VKKRSPTTSSLIRALLIAEAANPEWTSVPLAGWSHAMALRKRVNAHLITQIRNRESLLRAGLQEHVNFTAIDSEKLARPMWKLSSVLRRGSEGGWTTLQALVPVSYFYFEYLLWKLFGERIRSREYDVVHRITPLSPTTPSLLAKKCAGAGIPFVIGPLNGGLPWPKWFQQERKLEKEWLAPVRRAYRLVPGYRATLKYSAAILAGSRDTMRQLPRKYGGKIHYVPENAVDPSRFTTFRTRQIQLPLQLLFVGRLVPYKGADMAIEAAAPLLADGCAELTIVGDGPQRLALEAMVRQLPRPDSVHFIGHVPHTDVQRYFANADVFVFPSIREFGGGVVVEAMLMGVIPLVVDYGGPAELVTPDTGFKVKIGPRPEIVASVRTVLEQLAAHPSLVSSKVGPAQERVQSNFSWDAKARDVVRIYEGVLRSNGQHLGDLSSTA
jgi:glycosyltransferase involved in cell wall biosynthesis